MQIAKVLPIQQPIEASLNVPGSKSYSLRALFISFLCADTFRINNLLDSADSFAMQNCLADLQQGKNKLFAGESGITSRFITALSCISNGAQIIDGAAGLRKRPIKDLVSALKQLGADIEYLGKEGFLPLKVKSSKFEKSEVRLKGNVSSQYLSALLLIAPKLRNGLTINIKGKQVSKPYIDMTIDIMNDFGVNVENQKYKKYVIKPQVYVAHDYSVESDYSSASYFFAIAALTNSKITVKRLNADTKQADAKFLPILEKMGAKVSKSSGSITVTGKSLKPVDINMNDCPDQAMTVAILAAFARGITTISGIKSLRVKETERIKAIENELAKMGIRTESTEDSLKIYSGEPKPASIDTYGDHRIAMAFAVAGTKLENINITNPKVVNKTFPGFWEGLRKFTRVDIQDLNYSNIILIGMRGTGKSTVGKIIAKKLKMEFVDVDKYIELKNKINIKQAVQEHGWIYFRLLEIQAVDELSRRANTVISTGAGAILDDRNVVKLRNKSLVFMLKAEPKTLAKRIKQYNKLPALTAHSSVYDELEEVWKERKERYYSSSDFIIETEKLTPEKVAGEIIAKL